MAVGQEVRFPATRRVGSLVLHLEGYEPIPVRWHSSGEELLCASEPLVLESRAEMTLTGRVLNTAGNPEPDAWVQGCGPAQVDENGVFSVLPVRAPCALRAIRQDGFWYSRSEVTDIPWIEGGSLEVELVVNEYPRGGMGISIEPAEEGIGVLEVHAGSPAAIAGLQAGEIIVSLEGEPSLDLTLEQFVDRATGEAGTDVHFVVKGTDGSEREVTLTRAMLGP